MADSLFKTRTFIDNDGLKWKYLKSGITGVEVVIMHDKEGKVKYEIAII